MRTTAVESKAAALPEVQALSAREKLQLVDDLWISLARDLEKLEVSDEEKRLLDERWASYERNPASALTLEQLKAKIDHSHR
jgi:putative addiction module component (TIGR02574 family)